MSDIIFLRAWYPVKPKSYYNTVTSLLLKDKSEWQGMRTNGQIRRDEGLKLFQNKDSFYRPIERKERVFSKLRVPRTLQAALPFSSKPKLLKKQNRPSLMQKRAVLLEPHEQKEYALMQSINTIKNAKEAKRKEKQSQARAAYMKKKALVEKVDVVMQKERSKDFHREQGKKRAREEAAASSSRHKSQKRD